MPLVGATVLIKGTTTGAAADIDGNFSLPQAKPGDTLEISLIGYTKQELPVSGSAPLSVVMHEDNEVLDAVVVTALGIKRSEKALTYNVQEVAGDIVNTVKDANFMNSLSGKVAGLQINASASGVGGSTRVVMRGVKSISGNNNALYVIDGIPMPDLRSSQTEGTYETPDGGDFEGISNLNPEDIESMTVLSGATAAALYGSQGANGVIVITTKKGEEGRVRVNYANNTTFSSPFVMPQFQNTYGRQSGDFKSWGEKLGITTVGDLNDKICGGDLAELILVQEAMQESRIGRIAEDIAGRKGVKFVMIAGPSSSGKTTFSHRLSIQLKTFGLTPHPIEVDNYFVNREKTPRDADGNYNFESLDAIDTERFNRDMCELLEGKRIELPTFNFKTGKREYKGNFLQLGADDILVIEGIHGLNDKMSYALPNESKYKIYISALTSLNVDEHNRISTADGRLLRRLVRDARTRGTSAGQTIAQWPSVRRGEEENIFPFLQKKKIHWKSLHGHLVMMQSKKLRNECFLL